MTAYKGNYLYREVENCKCSSCAEDFSLEHSVIWHDDFMLCEYCAPVVIARLAGDMARIADYSNLTIRTEHHIVPNGFHISKPAFQKRHVVFLENLLKEIKRVNGLEAES